MKRLIFLILILPSTGVFAQKPADSNYFFEQHKANLLTAQKNATFLIAAPLDKIGVTQLFYANSSGGFRMAQQAQRTTVAGVNTEGISKFGRFQSTGHFSFKRTWQDSLAWSTKGLEQDDQPYYYGSIKAGAFERINYNLGGILTYNLIKEKLYIGTRIDYEYNSATRSVDPRPDVDTYRLIVAPELTYRYKKSLLGANVKWGYGNETIGIAFKNDDFRNSTTGYPDRVNYLIQGYGLITNFQGVSNPLKRTDKFYGAGINHHIDFGRFTINSSISYLNQQEDNFQDFAVSPVRAYASYYDTDWLDFSSQINKRGNNTSQYLALNYTNQKANDINIIFYAVNYRYAQTLADLKYLLRWNVQKPFSPEVGIFGKYREVTKTDYAADHFVNYSKLETAILANGYFRFSKNERLGIGTEFAYNSPLQSHITVPVTQQTVFTKGVVFPDYSYFTSSSLRLSVQANLITSSILRQFRTGIVLKGNYYHMVNMGEVFANASHHIGNQFADINLAFNLYF